MAKNKPGQQQAIEHPRYDWKADAIAEWEDNAMTRGCAVALGVLDALQWEVVTSIDHNAAVRWAVEFKRRADVFDQRQARQAARVARRVGVTTA